MNENAQDTLKIFKACKTEEEARRAGILMDITEVSRKFNEIDWSEIKSKLRVEEDTCGFLGNLPGRMLRDGGWEPLPCFVCSEPIEIGETYKKKSLNIAHEHCVKERE